MIAPLALLLPLGFIIYEDFRARAIHWYWIALMLLISLVGFPWQAKWIGVNLLLVGFQMSALTVYFSLKEGKLVNIIDRYLGLGDLLFFLPLCVLFAPANFIFFFIFSFVLSLSSHLFLQYLLPQRTQTIPLAAYMAIALIGVLAGTYFFDFDPQNDYWIKYYLAQIARNQG